MSTISGVGSFPGFSSYQQLGIESANTSLPSTEVHETHLSKRETSLGESLQAAGINEETAKQIKKELRSTVEQGFAEGHDQAAREAVSEEVNSLFAEYGLDASEFVGRDKGPGGGGPRGGPAPPGAKGKTESDDSLTTETESYETVLELLEILSTQETEPTELAQLIIDALYGLDESV